MYSLSYFNRAYYELQCEEVFTHGQFIDWYDNVALYAYSDFFIEVTYLHDTNEIGAVYAISLDQAAEYENLNGFHLEY
jgi:hypothetical protein